MKQNVGLAGFEPAHDRIKTYCLTAWLQPIQHYYKIFFLKIKKNQYILDVYPYILIKLYLYLHQYIFEQSLNYYVLTILVLFSNLHHSLINQQQKYALKNVELYYLEDLTLFLYFVSTFQKLQQNTFYLFYLKINNFSCSFQLRKFQ